MTTDCCDPVITVSEPIIEVVVTEPGSSIVLESTDTLVTEVETPTIVLLQEPQITIIEIGTLITPGGGGSTDVEVIYLPFVYTDASPKFLAALSPNDIVMNCEVIIIQAFDDPNATLTVGTPAINDAEMGADDISPNFAFPYGTDNNYIATVGETLNLYITPGSSMMGSGYVLLTVKRTS